MVEENSVIFDEWKDEHAVKLVIYSLLTVPSSLCCHEKAVIEFF